MILLVLAPVDVWFGGWTWVKWTWILFDAVFMAGLVRLIQRPSLRLATLLATASTLDAILTPAEVWVWNLHQTLGHDVALLGIGAGCAGPAFASVVLWGATVRFRRVFSPSSAA